MRARAYVLAVAALALLAPTTPASAEDLWSDPQTLSVPGQNSADVSVGSSADGKIVVAAWYSLVDNDPVIFAARSTDGGSTWQPRAQLSAEARPAFSPKVLVSDNGSRATVVWLRSNGVNNILQAASSDDGAKSWTLPADVSQAGNSARTPAVYASADGKSVFATWRALEDPVSVVKVNRSLNGGRTWREPLTISEAGKASWDPAITGSDDASVLVAMWATDEGGLNRTVYSSRSTDVGVTWSAPSPRSQLGTYSRQPALAASSDGDRMAAGWLQLAGAEDRLQVRRSTTGGQIWDLGSFVSPLGMRAGWQEALVAHDGSRMALGYRGDDKIWLATREQGDLAWNAPVLVSKTVLPAAAPDFAMSGNGRTVAVVWDVEVAPDQYSVQWARSSDGGQTWPQPVTVSKVMPSLEARLALSDDGAAAVVAWLDTSAVASSVKVARLVRPPTAPQLDAVASSPRRVTLTWSPPQDNGGAVVSGYEYRLNGGGWTALPGSAIQGLRNGTDYSIQIRALNAAGASTASNALTATPIATPKGLKVTARTKRTSVRWTKAKGAQKYRVTLKSGKVAKKKVVTKRRAVFKTKFKRKAKVRVCVVGLNDSGRSKKRCKRVRVR